MHEEETSCYRGDVPAVSEEELQTVGVGGLDGLTDVYQPHLQQNAHHQNSTGSGEERPTGVNGEGRDQWIDSKTKARGEWTKAKGHERREKIYKDGWKEGRSERKQRRS